MVLPVRVHLFSKFRREQSLLVVLMLAVAALCALSIHLGLDRAAVKGDLAAAQATNAEASRTIRMLQMEVERLALESESNAAAVQEARERLDQRNVALAQLGTGSDERINRLLVMARKPGANCETPPELLRELAGL